MDPMIRSLMILSSCLAELSGKSSGFSTGWASDETSRPHCRSLMELMGFKSLQLSPFTPGLMAEVAAAVPADIQPSNIIIGSLAGFRVMTLSAFAPRKSIACSSRT